RPQASAELDPRSLHDALPISPPSQALPPTPTRAEHGSDTAESAAEGLSCAPSSSCQPSRPHAEEANSQTSTTASSPTERSPSSQSPQPCERSSQSSTQGSRQSNTNRVDDGGWGRGCWRVGLAAMWMEGARTDGALF